MEIIDRDIHSSIKQLLDDVRVVDRAVVFQELPWLYSAVKNACVEHKQFRSRTSADDKGSIIRIRISTLLDMKLVYPELQRSVCSRGRIVPQNIFS